MHKVQSHSRLPATSANTTAYKLENLVSLEFKPYCPRSMATPQAIAVQDAVAKKMQSGPSACPSHDWRLSGAGFLGSTMQEVLI